MRSFKRKIRVFALALLLLIPAWSNTNYTRLEMPTLEQQVFKSQVDFVEKELRSRVVSDGPFDAHYLAETLVMEAHVARLDPLFVLAVMEAESNFHLRIRSRSNAIGLMQVLPSTFKGLDIDGDLWEPGTNIKAGVKCLYILTTMFKRPESVLLAYNGGPTRATRYLEAKAAGEDTSYYPMEMKAYPGKVMSKYRKFLAKTGQNPAHAHKLYRNYKSKPVSTTLR